MLSSSCRFQNGVGREFPNKALFMKTEGIDRKWLGEFEFQVFLNVFVWFRRSSFTAKK